MKGIMTFEQFSAAQRTEYTTFEILYESYPYYVANLCKVESSDKRLSSNYPIYEDYSRYILNEYANNL